MVILKDGICGNGKGICKWSGPMHGERAQGVGAFMLVVSSHYADQADDDVLEWSLKSSVPYEDGGTPYGHVLGVSPYAIDRGSERLTVSPSGFT